MTPVEQMARADIDSFYTLDTAAITRTTSAFSQRFTGKVLYAVKANPLPQVLEAIVSGGAFGFDVASINEVHETAKFSGQNPSFFMNPAKNRRDIDTAYRSFGIKSFVVDSQPELDKLLDVLPSSDDEIGLYVRLTTEKSSAIFDLSSKFGADAQDAMLMGKNISASTKWRAGLAFHVGSQTTDAQPYVAALNLCETLIEKSGGKFSAVDIGGGFPGRYLNSCGGDFLTTLDTINARIRASKSLSGVEVFSEPGRVLVNESMSLFSRVNLRKDRSIYLSEGVYGGLLSAQKWLKFPVSVWRDGAVLAGEDVDIKIFGPTCDSLDQLGFLYELPACIGEGDWLEFKHVGAYSVSLRTHFNGFRTEEIMVTPPR